MPRTSEPEPLRFSHRAGAWYAEHPKPMHGRGGLVDQITVGRYLPDGDCEWKIVLAWLDLERGRPPVLQVRICEEAFGAFAELPELWKALAPLRGTRPAPERIVSILTSLGVTDHTPRRPR